MLYMSTTLLFLPVMLSLARVLACTPGGMWLDTATSLTCWAAGHTLLAVAGCVAVVAFGAVVLTGSL